MGNVVVAAALVVAVVVLVIAFAGFHFSVVNILFSF